MKRNKAWLKRLFKALAVKEASGRITPAELNKMWRCQALLRPRALPGQAAHEARLDWEFRLAVKAAGMAMRKLRAGR